MAGRPERRDGGGTGRWITDPRPVAAALMILIINLISGIVGPQLVGAISDLSMQSAGTASLGISLLIVATICSLWSALHFYLASRSVERDLLAARQSVTP